MLFAPKTQPSSQRRMPGLLNAQEPRVDLKTAGDTVFAEKANLCEQFDGDRVASTDSSDSSTDALSLCVPEIVVTPPNWPSSADGGLMLDFSCQGWSSSSPEEYSGDSDDRECAAILDRLSLSSSPRLKSPQRPVAPDLVLRAARRELLLQEIDAWSRIADERLARWLQGSASSSASPSSTTSGSSSRTRDAQLASRAATRRQPRTRDVDLRVWVLHRAVGTRHELSSPRELSARPPWALLV